MANQLSNQDHSFLVLHRKGIIIPSKYTDNQCKTPTHSVYTYRIQCVFDQQQQLLDDNGFLFDHNQLDKYIHGNLVSGSCEEMHEKIFILTTEFAILKNLRLVGYKCTIMPSEDPAAFMEKVVVNNPLLLSLLK